MPTYEYRCLKCNKKFEMLQNMSDPPAKKCPKCGGRPERLISGGTGLIFKGTGFYITDYKNKAKDSGQKKGEPVVTKKEVKTEPKKESAPGKSSG
jgi:putative FmdB family regulatory protein